MIAYVRKRNAGTAPGDFGEATDTANDTATTPNAQAAKAVAMLLYHCGGRTRAATQAAFARHPEWASA